MRVVLLQPPPGRRHQWPVMMLMVVFTAGSLLYRSMTDVPPVPSPADLDAPPEPGPLLFPTEPDPPSVPSLPEPEPPKSPPEPWEESVSTNGWALLQRALREAVEEEMAEDRAARASSSRATPGTFRQHAVSQVEKREYLDILAGKNPWNDTVMEKIRRGGVMTERMEEALRKPDFHPAVSPAFHPLWKRVMEPVEADFAQALHAGNMDRARRCVSALTRLSALILRESRTGEDYDLAEELRRLAAALTFRLLAADPANRAAAAALLEDWSSEAPEEGAAVRKLVRLTLEQRALAFRPWASSYSWPGLRSRPNRTSRLLLAEARRIREDGFPPAAAAEDSPPGLALARYTFPFAWLSASDSNREGLTESMPSWAFRFAWEDRAVRAHLFLTRAMRAALAVWVWRMDHSGALPPTLTELTPRYLKTAEADPWTGGPLGWDQAEETIHAAGPEWKTGKPPWPLRPGRVALSESPVGMRLPCAGTPVLPLDAPGE